MKALTISQPYASLIADGHKFVENRTWKTEYQGLLAIHAGKGSKYLSAADLRTHQTSKILAVVRLECCVQVNATRDYLQAVLPNWLTADHFRNHQHTEGPWCWVLKLIDKLDKPIVASGHRMLWEFPGLKNEDFE